MDAKGTAPPGRQDPVLLARSNAFCFPFNRFGTFPPIQGDSFPLSGQRVSSEVSLGGHSVRVFMCEYAFKLLSECSCQWYTSWL